MPAEDAPLTKAEVLTALSRALDMVEGQPPGHAVRTLWIAVRIAQTMGLSEAEQDDLYFASLVKDSGCSNNSVRIQKIFGGDELVSKRAVKTVDWSSELRSTLYALKYVGRGQPLGERIASVVRAKGESNIMREVTEARCTRGAEIARRLGFSPRVAETIRDLDEHWDGRGAPYGLKRTESGLLARILGCAQTMEVFATEFGVESAYRMLARRKGRWFDPEIAKACRSFKDDEIFWASHRLRAEALALELPVHAASLAVPEAEIDGICEAFAMIIDAKSSFTAEHSARVTRYAVEMGEAFGFDSARLTTLRRAALLHDVGKLGVSTGILEKPGKLDDDEFAKVRLHPRNTWAILSPIRTFGRLADLAAAHHEKLDGKGYWRGWDATPARSGHEDPRGGGRLRRALGGPALPGSDGDASGLRDPRPGVRDGARRLVHRDYARAVRGGRDHAPREGGVAP